MNEADDLDSKVDNLQNQADSLVKFPEYTLGASSALFGAILGWIINAILTEMNWRKEEVK